MTRVSIIIPCYNAEAFVGPALESAFAQTHPDLEVIAVDDGSADGTGEVLRRFEGRASVLRGPNRGAAVARNMGTATATGDCIQYLDADDLLEPDAVATRLAALEASGAEAAYGGWTRLREQETGRFEVDTLVDRRMEEVHSDPQVALMTGFWCPPAAVLYRRSLVERIGGWKQHLAPIEDARFLLDAALAGARFVHVPGSSALYRVGLEPSHSRRSPLRFVHAVLANALEVEELWRSSSALPEARRRALRDVYGHCARELFRPDPEGFRTALRALKRVDPGLRADWPRLAALLSRAVGRRAATGILEAVGRPAP